MKTNKYMKNLELEDLPYRESIHKNSKIDWYRQYYRRGGIYKKIDDKLPWKYIDRLLKKYKGKKVDIAFAEYCSKAEKCQQDMFWDTFVSPIQLINHRRHYSRWDYWYIDTNKVIQRSKALKKKVKYVIQSHDIKWGYIHCDTGKEITGSYGRYSNKAVYGVIQGQLFEFDKKDASYHKCYAEQLSKGRKLSRQQLKESRDKSYSFLTKEEQLKIEEREVDKVKLISKGFNEESFTSTGGRLKD